MPQHPNASVRSLLGFVSCFLEINKNVPRPIRKRTGTNSKKVYPSAIIIPSPGRELSPSTMEAAAPSASATTADACTRFLGPSEPASFSQASENAGGVEVYTGRCTGIDPALNRYA